MPRRAYRIEDGSTLSLGAAGAVRVTGQVEVLLPSCESGFHWSGGIADFSLEAPGIHWHAPGPAIPVGNNYIAPESGSLYADFPDFELGLQETDGGAYITADRWYETIDSDEVRVWRILLQANRDQPSTFQWKAPGGGEDPPVQLIERPSSHGLFPETATLHFDVTRIRSRNRDLGNAVEYSYDGKFESLGTLTLVMPETDRGTVSIAVLGAIAALARQTRRAAPDR
jgi:hypothetical protein